MPGSVSRSPIRKPRTFPHLRDEIEMDGKKYREHVVGLSFGKDEKTGLVQIERVADFHRVRGTPRIPRDKRTRKRGKHRRDL